MPMPAPLKATRGSLTMNDLKRFAELIQQVAGMEITPAREGDLRRAISRRLNELPSRDPDVLFASLTDPTLQHEQLESLLADLTVGETYFFRDRPQMDALETKILPEVLERNAKTRTIRIWSAGCSTGAEPYSVAILLRRLVSDLDRWKILILATDINRAALAQAAKGLYTNWSFRQMRSELRDQYFRQSGARWEIDPGLRAMVTFRYLNLAQDPYPSLLTQTVAMDLILCRNVLMYFSAEMAEMVRGRLYECLKDEGWLLVGHAEPSPQLSARFAPHSLPGTTAYQKSLPAETPDVQVIEIPESNAALTHESDFSHSSPIVEGHQETSGRLRTNTLPRADLSGRKEYLRAKASADAMDFLEANRQIEASLGSNPLLASAQYLRGLLCQEEGDLQEALDSLRRSAYVAPDWPLAHYALAIVLARLGRRSSALKSLQNVRELLEGVNDEEAITDGDGLTAGRLRQLAEIQKELIE